MANDVNFNKDLCKVLETALSLVTGDRANMHGNAVDQHNLASDFWTVYLQGRGFIGTDTALAPHDVSQMMLLLKISRGVEGAFNLDTYIDQCGYAALTYAIMNKDG